MDLTSVFKFEKSSTALANLEKLITCNTCNEYCRSPTRHSDCGYLLCSCLKRGKCPGCGQSLLPSNTTSAYHAITVIEAAKTIKSIISENQPEATSCKKEVKEKGSDRPQSNIHTEDVPNFVANHIKNEKASGDFKVPNCKSSLQKKNKDTLTPSPISTEGNVRYSESSRKPLEIHQKEGSFPINREQQFILKEMPPSLKAIMKRNSKGETKLHSACIKGDIKKVQEFLKQGADPCTKDNAGWTPLHEAVSKGFMDIIKLLLEAGAMVDVPGGYNNTPLHDAALNNHLEAARLLIAFGASPHMRNIEGLTPLSMAQTKEMEKVFKDFNPSKAIARSTKCHLYQHEIVLYGSRLLAPELKLLNSVAERFKLKIVSSYISSVTHLVVSTNDKRCSPTTDVLQSIIKGIWIVDTKWLQSCLDNKTVVDPSEHEIIGTTRFPDSFAAKRSRENAERMLPRIFNGCHFYFSGVDKVIIGEMKFSKSQLSSLVSIGDGFVLNREPNPEAIPAHECTVPFHANTGPFSKCSHFIIYQPGRHEPLLKYNMAHVKSLPVLWLIDCIETFSLVEASHL